MERSGGGFKKGGRGFSRAGTSDGGDKGSAPPAKGKFKLRTSKDPLPLLAKKQPSRESKPKAKFLASAGAGAATEKQNNAKPDLFSANSFMRPLATDAPSKKSTGFSFMKLQPTSTELGKPPADTSTKAVLPSFSGLKPLLGKFSANALTKKKSKPTSETGTKNKKPLFKPQAKGTLPFAFRAETKSSTAKKRKAAESLPEDSKTGRAKPSFALKNPARGKNTENQSEVCGENTKASGSSTSFATKMGAMRTKVNDGAVLKKRGLLAISTVAVPASKRSKTQDVRSLGDPNSMTNGVIKSGRSPSGDARHENEASSVSASLVAPVFKPAQTSPGFVVDAELGAVPSSPDWRDDCLSGVEEELAMKLLCTVDDDKEDEFLTRAAAIQEFTDRMGLEQKQLHNRLLDAHADVSESLLDALTDLMVEEGGIGIDKLDFDMNIDVDVNAAFLQDDEIQVIQ
ncbi:hypothetical protein PC129_g1295 [Phytophthora cactorum]|uniref:Uncharacterized protein n=1 Tax=Phytophthora cactorum TaxID=29920 RepID=A0A329SP39_9STRA|nr:hypothetical protein Pcac1_g23269 [Phytophthora cactorum]KAG2842493.1 hypothetical protein PC112_g3004 [Phytophthora cactorum]KAG2843590.1 hypothetical protein PC111_g2270 [Phytophthora cactorum]KAG2866111.1 hypothetical protein PC113_g3102 [Phytophthora cactorum]KAG2927074.1 hypothetical protein PC114_g3608 [Phytophthora cactorum]